MGTGLSWQLCKAVLSHIALCMKAYILLACAIIHFFLRSVPQHVMSRSGERIHYEQ